MRDWLTKIFEYLFRRGSGTRVDFEAVNQGWHKLFDTQGAELVVLRAEVKQLRIELGECQIARARQEVRMDSLDERLKAYRIGGGPRT